MRQPAEVLILYPRLSAEFVRYRTSFAGSATIGTVALGEVEKRGYSERLFLGTIAAQLEHVDWAGFHFYDLIFPLFVFIAGVSLVFSLSRIVAERVSKSHGFSRQLCPQ